MEGRKVHINVNTTESYLGFLELTIEEVKSKTLLLMKILGTKFPVIMKLGPTSIYMKMEAQDIDRLLLLLRVFTKIEECKGFKKHLKEYNKNNVEDHLFTANTAIWYLDNGFEVELEPDLYSPSGGHPDLLIAKSGNKFAVECKRIDQRKFFDLEKKEAIANIIFQKVKTCDQITLYLRENFSLEEVDGILNEESISSIYRLGCTQKESLLSLHKSLDINIIQKPTIVGKEDDFPCFSVKISFLT